MFAPEPLPGSDAAARRDDLRLRDRGFDAAFDQARAAAGDADVTVAGGASTIRRALAAGAIDELVLDVAPVLLGGGERLLDGVTDPGLTQLEVTSSPRVLHVRYRVG